MTYKCKCKCENFAEHVGTGPYISASATPSRNVDVKFNLDTEKRWHKENDAFKRLAKEGHVLSSLNGADKIEAQATTEVELKHGKIYGDKAALMDKADKGELYA